jgi:hypothetical protein
MEKYIYFHRDIDLYNTEQFGAFLYEFMENIQISKLLGRILVLPNAFIAPRNNKKIVDTQKISLKSASLIPLEYLIDIKLLEKVVPIISLPDFYELTYKGDNVLVHNSNNIRDNTNYSLKTSFDNINIEKQVKMPCNMTTILQNINVLHTISNKNLIFYNYGRLPQPNWHNATNLDYKIIRTALNFTPYVLEKSEQFIRKNNIVRDNTLTVHWRVGDRSLETLKSGGIPFSKYESETLQYFDKFNELSSPANIIKNILEIKLKNNTINTVFLVHNNADNKALEYVNTELAKFKVKIVEFYNKETEPFCEQYEGMIQQIIGAHCKYQLYGPTCYERMSAFGRWIIETSMYNVGFAPVVSFIG